MPDISMCLNKECKDKDTCYRFKAKPCDYQCYIWKTGELDKNTCDSYWKMKGSGGIYGKGIYSRSSNRNGLGNAQRNKTNS